MDDGGAMNKDVVSIAIIFNRLIAVHRQMPCHCRVVWHIVTVDPENIKSKTCIPRVKVVNLHDN